MLKSILTSSSVAQIDIMPILICSICSILFGLCIALTHKYTSKANKNFLVTLSILPMLVQTIIIMASGNLGTSIAIMGAFSLIRFRSLPGSSKEILSVFFAMVVGLATGMGQILFAFIIVVIGCLFLLLFSKISIFDLKKEEKILKITIPENLDYTNVFDDVFAKYVAKAELETVKTTNMGSMFDLSYHLTLLKGIDEKAFIDDLRIKNGNLKIILTHPLEENNL